LISFIKHHRFDVAEVDVASADVIEDTSGGSHEEVNSTTQLTSLVFDADTTVDSDNGKLVLSELQSLNLVRDLYNNDVKGESSIFCSRNNQQALLILTRAQVFQCF